MTKYSVLIHLTLLITSLDIYYTEIFTGIADLNYQSDYFTKFCFLSSNSSIQFEFAFLEDILPVKLKSFWDAPRMWLAASQRPLISCSKRQALLNSLSSNQLFHLDPFMDGWCQRISLSNKIYSELMQISYQQSIDWRTIMTMIIAKITGYFNRLIELTKVNLPINYTLNNLTIVKPLINMTTTHSYNIHSYQSIESSLPDVITMAWLYYTSTMNQNRQQQSFILSQWIYCQSPNIQFIVNRPSWWFFTFDNCNEHKINNIIENSMKSQQIYTRNKIAYRLTLRNGENNDVFHEHFSSQEFGKLEIDLIFFILLGGLFLVANLLLVRLYRRNLLHHTVILWYTSIGLRFIGQLIQLIVDMNFARTGYFNLFNISLVNFFYSISISSFYTSLLILGSGFTIVYQSIPYNHMITFLIVTISYTVINLICQISMGLTHYEIGIFTRYHSNAGYIYIGLQGISFIVYLFICSYTCIKWSGKRIFFLRFMIISCIWFWTVPLWILLTANYVYHWYIETMIRVFDELVHLIGFLLMMIILRPDRINLIFPYYTNTISIIDCNKQQQQQRQQDDDDDDDKHRQHQLITEQSINSRTSSSLSTTKKSLQLSNISSQINKNVIDTKKIPPKRPNPPRLFNLTGKPGDIPAPGSIIISDLNKSPIDSTKRSQTTSTLSINGSHSPHIKSIDKDNSTH
ncbi:hypothetical protein MN116_008787 [Schistosoma mekongi]|uniref:Intimal thickness related receptor IRP domain-containing protein n=1 Tax=Schistosoma mekongi TaxID=38744 RepID=A0AAE1Z5Q3_SCHME|nr:hypothetical protein MN116_008787 [Schistosoma mekongi]